MHCIRWSPPNEKTEKLKKKYGANVWSVSLLSGHTCPGADLCLAKVTGDRSKRKLIDGPTQVFRCFSASQEAIFKDTFSQRLINMEVLRKASAKSVRAVFNALDDTFPRKVRGLAVRLHIAGDIFSMRYLQGLCKLCDNHADVPFYGYTKSLHILDRFYDRDQDLSDNLKLVLSAGGKFDHLIDSLKKRGHIVAYVFKTEADVPRGLEIDHDDSHAFMGTEDFALVVHGMQPAKKR